MRIRVAATTVVAVAASLVCAAGLARAADPPRDGWARDSRSERVDERSSLLNNEGMRRYKAKDYEAAARLFRDAIEADPDRPLPHYNLACTLALLRAAGKQCETDASVTELVSHLEDAIRLDKDRRAKAAKDRDFDSVRNRFAFQRALGLTSHDDAHARTLLVLPDWHGPNGAYHLPASGIDFHDDGTAELWTRAPGGDTVPPPKTATKGRWTVAGGTVTVTLAQPFDGRTTLSLLLTDDGVLEGDGLRFTDEIDECGF